MDGGENMTKIVRAFSLDQGVSEELDEFTRVPGVLKPMNKSKYVNQALKFYMRVNIKEMVQENEDYKAYLATATNNLADARVTIGGLEAQLADSLEDILRLEGYIRELEARIMELNHEIRDLQDRPGLLGRLWRLLRKRE